jgi:hypothetical protein
MPSENHFSADNQQEKLIYWIIGFVDGEGTFSVSFNKNSTTSTGWQIFPEFVITQGAKSLTALEEIQKFFECGKLYINRRKDNHKENIYRFCVRSFKDLDEKIVPFFQKHSLRTAKKEDFNKFVEILSLIKKGIHLTPKGASKIAKIIETMNRKKQSRYLLSSETTRQAHQSDEKI